MKHDLSRVIRNGDRGILEELRKAGDTLLLPRHTIVFFYLRRTETRDPEVVLNPLAQRAQQMGWRVSGLDGAGLTIETEHRVDPDSVNEMSRTMEEMADEFDVEFDGWECAVLGKGDKGR